MVIGYSDSTSTGSFTQTGGTNSSGSVYIGSGGPYAENGVSASSGNYSLAAGLLSPLAEYVGAVGAGTFVQSGGTNTVSFLSLGNAGCYQLAGGSLQIDGGFVSSGTLDGAGVAETLNVAAGSIVDFTQGTVVNSASTAFTVGPGSIVIVNSGSNPASEFGAYSNAGITHVLGTTLNVAASQSFGGWGTFADPVVCQGSLIASPSGAINLTNGLILSASGIVNLGNGNLTVNDSSSGINSGSLTALTEFIASSGTNSVTQSGTFTQSGGTNALAGNLDLAYSLGSNINNSGTYKLSGPSLLAVQQNEYVGSIGSGTFVQSGGTHTIGGNLYVGDIPSASGLFTLGGGLLVTQQYEYVGYFGTGTFTQTAGTNAVNGTLSFVQNSGATGTYNLNGGILGVANVYVGLGNTGLLSINGGTLQALASFNIAASSNFTLTSSTSGNFDSNGYTLTITQGVGGGGSLTKFTRRTRAGRRNSYSGNTLVDGGILEAKTTAALPNYNVAGKVSVAGGAFMTVSVGGAGQWQQANVDTFCHQRLLRLRGVARIRHDRRHLGFHLLQHDWRHDSGWASSAAER